MSDLKIKTKIQWHYEIDGQGDPIIFLHGWGASAQIWRQQLEYFSNNFRTVAFDLPGHGESSWQPISLGEMAEEILSILESLRIETFSVVASSLGGLLAIHLMEWAPGKIKKICFVGALPKFSQSADYPHGLELKRIHKLSGQLDTDYPSIVQIFFRSLFTQQERLSDRFKWIQSFPKDDDVPQREALRKFLEIIDCEDLRENLKRIRIPVQVMNGTDDYICSVAAVEFLKKAIPQARVQLFKNCGHFPFLTKPQEFNQILKEFLRS